MPKISRPKLPKGYVDNPISEVPWEHVEKRLTDPSIIGYVLCVQMVTRMLCRAGERFWMANYITMAVPKHATRAILKIIQM